MSLLTLTWQQSISGSERYPRLWTYSPGYSFRTVRPVQFLLFTWCRTFPLPTPPSANLQYKKRLPLTCTKLIEVESRSVGVRSTG